MRRLDVTGQKFWLLTAVKRVGTVKGRSRWAFSCDCGGNIEACLGNVKGGQVKSCGCIASRKSIGARTYKHGHGVGFRKTRTATAWRNAKTRCFNPNNVKYHRYGGRGITMCDAWSGDFAVFLRDMGECPEGMTLDRINNDGNYEPGNCRWATRIEQANNRGDNVMIGASTMVEFADINGVGYKRLQRRITTLGEPPGTAISQIRKLDAAKSR